MRETLWHDINSVYIKKMQRRNNRFQVPKSIEDEKDGVSLRYLIDSYVNSFRENTSSVSMIIPPTIDNDHIAIYAMESFILRFISEYPSHIKKFDQISDVVAVIVGGKALEYYLDIPKQNFTKDFDIRFCHLNNIVSPLFLREAIYLFRTLFYRLCPVFLLTVRNFDTYYENQQFEMPLIVIKKLYQQDETFLQTIFVNFQEGTPIPVIDLLPYNSEYTSKLKYTIKPLQSPVINVGEGSSSSLRFTRGSRMTYFGNIINPVRTREGIFYANFSYLLWDMVGVINEFIDEYPYMDKERRILKKDYMYKIKGLTKYIHRYKILIDALDDSRMLSCNTFPSFLGSCSTFIVDTSENYFKTKLGIMLNPNIYSSNPDVYNLIYNVYGKSIYKMNRTVVIDGDKINIFRANPTLLIPFNEMKLYVKDVVEFFAMRTMIAFNKVYSSKEGEERHTCIFVGGSALVVHFTEAEGLLTYDLDIKMIRENGSIASTSLIMEQFVSSIFLPVEEFFRNKIIVIGSENYVLKFRMEQKHFFRGGEMKLARIAYTWGNWIKNFDIDYILDLASKLDEDLEPEGYIYEDLPLKPYFIEQDKISHEYPQLNRTYRNGYYNTRILRNAIFVGGLYYVGIGYVLWDNMRMLNTWIDRGNKDKVIKYVRKYIAILDALENPEKHLNCISMRNYVNKCMQI